MLKNLLFGTGFLILVSGCAMKHEITPEETRYHNTEKTYTEGTTALERYSAEKDCNSSNAAVVKR